jgi:hypothetical protein
LLARILTGRLNTMAGRVLALIWAVVCAGAQAAGVALFDPKNNLPLTKLEAVLDAPMAAHVREAMTKTNSVLLVHIDPNVIDSNEIYIPLFGEMQSFRGSKVCDPRNGDGNTCIWQSNRTQDGSSLYLFLTIGSPTVSGRIVVNGKHYQISGREGGQYQAIYEPIARPRPKKGTDGPPIWGYGKPQSKISQPTAPATTPEERQDGAVACCAWIRGRTP